ncbi:MAG: hypothetical protein L0I24_17165, partial [Pseudonocardia sp.]|nr:hypothetical protein [Pseudonocardia sp.]
MSGAVQGGARVVDVDAVERGREMVGVALAAHLSVGDDVEPGAFLGADREHGGVVLGLGEMLGRGPPQLLRAHPRREPAGEAVPVDEPVGLGVAADERGGKHLHLQD